MITDAEDFLSWARAEHTGRGVSLYARGEDINGPTAYGKVDDSQRAALLPLVQAVTFRRNGTS